MSYLTPMARPLEHLPDVAALKSLNDERHQDAHQASMTGLRPCMSSSLTVHVHQPLREAYTHPGFVGSVTFDLHTTSEAETSHLTKFLS